MPHPLENKIELKVHFISQIQTNGKIKPNEALSEALTKIITEIEELEKKVSVY